MAELFQNKYRIDSARKRDWNYGDDAAYFITICVHEMRHKFGYIKNAALVPTPLGELADQYWMGILEQFPYAMLDVHVIMPNHMHGILIIDKTRMPELGDPNHIDGMGIGEFNVSTAPQNDENGDSDELQAVQTRFLASQSPNEESNPNDNPNPKVRYVQTRLVAPKDPISDDHAVYPCILTSLHGESQAPRGGITGEMNPMLHENVSRILRWYKGRCSFEMHKIDPKFKWLGRFWEHIIRDFEEYERIRNYILNNPAKWEADRFYRK